MRYDDWKLKTPDYFDYEEGKKCRFCGNPVEDTKDFCSKDCKKGYWAD